MHVAYMANAKYTLFKREAPIGICNLQTLSSASKLPMQLYSTRTHAIICLQPQLTTKIEHVMLSSGHVFCGLNNVIFKASNRNIIYHI
jgi:hypothetical protein